MTIHLILNTLQTLNIRMEGMKHYEKIHHVLSLQHLECLKAGPVLEYFKSIAPEPKNKILFVSYQVNGTLGRRVMDGSKQVSILGKEGKIEVVSINCSTERLDGFSGHSDYNQLMSFVHRLRPKLRRVLVNHGEKKKSENLSMSIRRMYKVSSHYPQIQEAIKLF